MDPQKRATHQGVEILVAEDSPTQAEQLKHLLTERGYTVRVAANGKQALAAMHQCKPTLIISDVVMPEMGGYALCKEIKSQAELKDVPVILLTSLSKAQDVIKGLECGADNFIRKAVRRKVSSIPRRLYPNEPGAAQDRKNAAGGGDLLWRPKAFHHRGATADSGLADFDLRRGRP